MIKRAIISPCGTYRYLLTRIWSIEPHPRKVCWVMLNPSTADATQDDPTLRKCIKFSQLWGYDGLDVVNLFALRTPYPIELIALSKFGRDIVGPENDGFLYLSALDAALTVAAWGVNGSLNQADRYARSEFRRRDISVQCLGKSLSGQPKHPARLAYSTPLEPYFWV